MVIVIVIFFISIITAFGMLSFRAWQIRTGRVNIEGSGELAMPEVGFRHLEKNMLYLTKHIVQWLVLSAVKYWLIFVTKTKKWISENWPKFHAYFQKKPQSPDAKPTFIQRSIRESKIKIKRIKEKVKRDHQ